MKIMSNYTTEKHAFDNPNFGMLNMDTAMIARRLGKGLRSPELAQQAADVLEASRSSLEQISEDIEAHVLPNRDGTGVFVLVEEEMQAVEGKIRARINDLGERLSQAIQIRLSTPEESVLVGEQAETFGERVAAYLQQRKKELEHAVWKLGSLK